MITLKKFNGIFTADLTFIMKRAFDEDSRLHLGKIGGPPGYDNGDFIRKWFLSPYASPYVIMLDNDMIGGVNLWIRKDENNFLGTIFIDPKYENKGYGLDVWKLIEKMYPSTICWRTETPIFSRRNHNFYINKCGFKCVQIENPKDFEEGQFKLEKWMNGVK